MCTIVGFCSTIASTPGVVTDLHHKLPLLQQTLMMKATLDVKPMPKPPLHQQSPLPWTAADCIVMLRTRDEQRHKIPTPQTQQHITMDMKAWQFSHSFSLWLYYHPSDPLSQISCYVLLGCFLVSSSTCVEADIACQSSTID